MVKVKICGLKRVADAEMLNELRPDFAGFIFAPSKPPDFVGAGAANQGSLD